MNKKILLLSALGLLTMGTVSAQTTTSFESSEGFALGNINGQNSWVTTSYTETEGGPTLYIANQVVSNALFSQGSQSLKIDEETDFSGQSSAIIGAFYDFAAPLNSTHYSVSADFNVSVLDGSNFQLGIAGSESFIALFQFDYEGGFIATTVGAEGPGFVEVPNKTWTANTWYNLKIEVEGTVVKYYIDNALAYTGVAIASEQFAHMRFTHDNFGGFSYVDNIVVTDLSSASTKTQDKFAYSVYPNPFTDVINVAMEDKLIQGAHLTDMNGRVVKTFNVSGVSTTQLNASDLAAGTYLLNVKVDGITVVKQVIKK